MAPSLCFFTSIIHGAILQIRIGEVIYHHGVYFPFSASSGPLSNEPLISLPPRLPGV